MYWRVRRIGPEQIVRQYGVHAALIVSVLFNLFAMTKMNPSKAVTTEQKNSFDKFARLVTAQLFDANYLTYEDSMLALMGSELGPSVKAQQVQTGILPKTAEEMKAIGREMRDKKSVSCVRIDSLDLGQQDSQGLVPIDVKMQVITHTAEGVNGPLPFKLKFLMGQRKDNQEPIVAGLSISELSRQQSSDPGSTSQ